MPATARSGRGFGRYDDQKCIDIEQAYQVPVFALAEAAAAAVPAALFWPPRHGVWTAAESLCRGAVQAWQQSERAATQSIHALSGQAGRAGTHHIDFSKMRQSRIDDENRYRVVFRDTQAEYSDKAKERDEREKVRRHAASCPILFACASCASVCLMGEASLFGRRRNQSLIGIAGKRGACSSSSRRAKSEALVKASLNATESVPVFLGAGGDGCGPCARGARRRALGMIVAS